MQQKNIGRQAFELFAPAVGARASGHHRHFVTVIPLQARDQIQIEFVGASNFEMGCQHQ
jgi:hypothetical protein